MKTDWNVGELLSVSSGYWRGCALHAAVRLDFFTHMPINNPHGRAYSEKEIRSMLREAGVSNVGRHSFTGPNDSSILFGVA